MALFCFDFNRTIINDDFNDILADLKVLPGKGASFIPPMLKISGIKNQSELLQTIRLILNNHHYMAIVSSTTYLEVLKPTFKFLGLSSDEMAQIFVVPFSLELPIFSLSEELTFPLEQLEQLVRHRKKASDKNIQIERVITFLNAKSPPALILPSDVILVDNKTSNISKAKQAGYQAIIVSEEINPQPATYLKELQTIALQKGVK
jgi:hypothetical protein